MNMFILLLFQLWNQPSLRIFGFGEYFEGLIPDPITDLSTNPAFIKDIGEKYGGTFPTPQIYTKYQRFDDIDSIYIANDHDQPLLLSTEPINIYALYPKLGIGFRSGLIIRNEQRTYDKIERWIYGENGFIVGYKINKYLQAGAEYNFSWKTSPIWYMVTVWDTLENGDVEFRDEQLWSNSRGLEGGIGLKINFFKNVWLSQSIKYYDETIWYNAHHFFPRNWLRNWENNNTGFKSYTQFCFETNFFKVKASYSFIENSLQLRNYYPPYDSSINKYPEYCPKVGLILTPVGNVMIAGACVYDYQKYYYYFKQRLIFPVGLENKINEHFTFRLGTSFSYIFRDTYRWIAVWPPTTDIDFFSEFTLGVDYHPYEKMSLFFVSQDIFKINYKKWLFGLEFCL